MAVIADVYGRRNDMRTRPIIDYPLLDRQPGVMAGSIAGWRAFAKRGDRNQIEGIRTYASSISSGALAIARR